MVVKVDFKNKVSKEVEAYVQKHGGPYLDAVLLVCEKLEIEPEVGAKHLTKPIIEKLEIEGRAVNLIRGKKSNKLPF